MDTGYITSLQTIQFYEKSQFNNDLAKKLHKDNLLCVNTAQSTVYQYSRHFTSYSWLSSYNMLLYIANSYTHNLETK